MRLLSLFSGIGAFEKALNNLNISYDLVNYCEIDKYAARAYSLIHNVSESKNLIDVTKVNTTRSGLFFEALRIIKDTRPRFAIAENVKALVSKKFENEFNIVLGSLSRLGYNNYYAVLNAKDYGIPQNRERVFIISIRQDIDKGFVFPDKLSLDKKLGDLLEEDVDEKYHLSEDKVKSLSLTTSPDKSAGQYLAIKQATNKPICINSKGGRNGIEGLQPSLSNRIYSSEGIATACTTCYQPNIQHGLSIRKLTPLECFRLMGFDDKDIDILIMDGISDAQLYKLAGNSIVVDVLENIFLSLEERYPDTFKRRG